MTAARHDQISFPLNCGFTNSVGDGSRVEYGQSSVNSERLFHFREPMIGGVHQILLVRGEVDFRAYGWILDHMRKR